MHADHEVISHGFGLPQLVGVAVVHHVITVGQQETAKQQLAYVTRPFKGSLSGLNLAA